MSSAGSPPLILDVRPWGTAGCVSVVSIIASATVPWLFGELAVPAAFVLSITTAVLAALGLVHVGWLGGPRRIVRIVWQGDDRWFVTDAAGKVREARLHASSRIAAGAAWLSWRGDVRRSLLLTRYDVPPQELRRLLVRLRLTSHHATDHAAVA